MQPLIAEPARAGRLSPRDRDILRALARRIDSGDPGAHNNLGVLYFNKGMIEEAVEAFQRALEIDPALEVSRRNIEISYLATGFYERLVAELEERLRADPGDREARWRLVRALRHTGHLSEAIAEIQRLLATAPGELRLLLELGRAEQDAGHFEEARQAYERALRVDPSSAVLHVQLAQLQYHQGRNDQARRELLLAVDIAPDFGEAWHLLSFVLGDLGEEAEAAEALRRSRELRPDLAATGNALSIDRNSPARYGEMLGDRVPRPVVAEDRYLAHYHLGVALRQKGFYDEALAEFERGLEAGEDPLLARQAQAEVLLVAGRDAEAIELYESLVSDQPGSPKLWNELGVCRHRVGDVEGAESCYRRALIIDPSYVLASNNLGIARLDRGDQAGARAAFEAATGHGGFAEALCNLGLQAANQRRQRDALDAYHEAVRVDPQSAAAWTGIGGILAEVGRLEEARQALVRAVELEPGAAEPRYRLAFVLNRLGDLEGSLKETRRALATDAYFTAPMYRLAIELQFEYTEVLAPALSTDVRLAAGAEVPDFAPDAEEIKGIFAQLRPVVAEPRGRSERGFGLAEDYLGKGLLGKALAEVRRVAIEGGDAIEAALLTGEIFRRQRLEGEALERFDAALARLEGAEWSDRHARAWLGRGWSLLGLGRAGEAAEAAAMVEARDPASFDARLLAAETLLLRGRNDEAMNYFGQLAEFRPRDPALWLRLGSAARIAQRPARARRAFERALELDPDLLAARVDLGSLLLAEGAAEAAAREGRIALDSLPGYAEAALLVADAEEARGDLVAATAVLANLLEDDAYHLPALLRLGDVLMKAGRVGDAVVAFRRATRLDPGSPLAWAKLADAEEAAGDPAEAGRSRESSRLLAGGADEAQDIEEWRRPTPAVRPRPAL